MSHYFGIVFHSSKWIKTFIYICSELCRVMFELKLKIIRKRIILFPTMQKTVKINKLFSPSLLTTLMIFVSALKTVQWNTPSVCERVRKSLRRGAVIFAGGGHFEHLFWDLFSIVLYCWKWKNILCNYF